MKPWRSFTLAALPVMLDGKPPVFYCDEGQSPIQQCACGKDHIRDATIRARRDPTRTIDIRRSFIRNVERRWRSVARLVTEALVTQDVFGLRGPNVRAISLISQSSGRITAFQSWLDIALADIVLGYDRERWVGDYIHLAYARGWKHGEEATGLRRDINFDRAAILSKFTITELQGVIEVFSQQAVRAFADGLIAGHRPAEIARLIRQRADAIGIVRSRSTIQSMVIRAHGEATLDFLEMVGITHVGIIPETIPSPGRFHAIRDAHLRYSRDAARKKKVRRRSIPRDLVEILTAGDDLVCQICIDLAEGSPYTIKQARGLIPAHPNCRCAFVPLFDRRFAHGEDSATDIVDAWELWAKDPLGITEVQKELVGGNA